MQNNVDADTIEKDAPDWLKKIVSHSSIQKKLLGDVFWSFNARSSAPVIQKSAYDLSYLAFALRKFTLSRSIFSTRENQVEKIEPRHFSKDFDDIFQLKAAFISDFDHYCSDGQSDENQLQISLEHAVADSLRPHLIPDVVTEVLQKALPPSSTDDDRLEFLEKHMVDFYQALLYDPDRAESEFPDELCKNLKNYVSLRVATHSQPSDQALSHFELLSCCCIFQFASRYAKHQDELQNPPLTPSIDALPQPPLHRTHSYDDLDVVALPSRRENKDVLDDSQLSELLTSDSRQQPGAAASVYDLKSEMLKLRGYLRDVHRAIVNLHYSLLYWDKEDVAEKFVKLQRVLLEHKDVLFYGDNDRKIIIGIDGQKHTVGELRLKVAALAFQVLRQLILETAYFKDLRQKIDELVAKFNNCLRDENGINVVHPNYEMFDKLCIDVSLEQLHFAFDILEATQGADFGFRFKTRAAGIEAQPPSAPAAAGANAGVGERALLEQPSSAGVAAAVADNAVYTWLDLKGTVLSVALANEKEADLKKYTPRQLIYKRLCSFACAL